MFDKMNLTLLKSVLKQSGLLNLSEGNIGEIRERLTRETKNRGEKSIKEGKEMPEK